MLSKSTRYRWVCALVGAATAMLAAAPGAAFGATCPDTTSSQIFARWGDTADYSLAPGGSFERSLSWAKVGSPVLVAENNPF